MDTPVKDLMVGVAHMDANVTGSGTWTLPGSADHSILGILHERLYRNQYFGRYAKGNIRLASEYRRYWRDQEIFNNMWEVQTGVRGWYVEGSYRVSKRLEFGSYYSRWSVNWNDSMPGLVKAPSQGDPGRHLYDKVVTARVDLDSHWNIKIEGHFIDGYGGTWAYPADSIPTRTPTV